MDGMTGGITPTYNLAERGSYDGFGFGGGGLWLFAILALMWGGFGGNRFGNAHSLCGGYRSLGRHFERQRDFQG